MQPYKYTFRKFLRDWMLVIAMAAGALSYALYREFPALHPAGPALEQAASIIQPVLLFVMLFLTFCRIRPSDLKPCRWQLYVLLMQGGLYAFFSLLLWLWPDIPVRIGWETLSLCLICPTATACAVVTGKLGGDMAQVLSYTILVNLMVSVLIPLMVPLTNPVEGLDFLTASALILAKVFPLLILPCIAAFLVRRFMPRVHAFLLRCPDLSFYIWSFALTLAIAMSVRAIYHHADSLLQLAVIAGASLLACVFQFWAGKRTGSRFGRTITAGQAMGQKNTVFAIWVGYTFMNPLVSVAGGFYSLWHNIFNTWQLYRVRKKNEAR